MRRRMLARAIGPLLLLAGVLAAAPARAVPADDHAEALGALGDVRAAMAELMHAESSYATDKQVYRGLAQRAMNALVGWHGKYYVAGAGDPGDADGAIGHIDRLLDRKETPPWTAALRGAEANLHAAAANLLDAKTAHELMDFQIAASRALRELDVAVGRPDEADVFGGLEGALATTVLGVPAGARETDGCAPPRAAPAFGTHDGYIAYVAAPATGGPHSLPGPSGGNEVIVGNGAIILNTAAAALVAKLCTERTATEPLVHRVAATTTDAAPGSALAPPHPKVSEVPKSATGQPNAGSGGIPALYTEAQAKAGAQLYAQHCASCHGDNLQGTAAPSVAGKDFLDTAKRNGWTLQIIRYIVFTMMPRNSPGTLSPKQSAEVMAYLLASNCYPAGAKPFPAQDDPSFSKIPLGPVSAPGANQRGVCPVD
jgi:polar amino acid transport system substrate-binding protein